MALTKTKVKRPRRTFKEWWAIHKPSRRRLIQIYAALLYNANIKGYISGEIYTGDTKYACVPGLNCYSCPGAVGACPLGALQNSLASSDKRAPYFMLGILALFGLIFARTICGFLCPVGLGQELLYMIRTPKLKKSRFTRVLSYFKYVLLALLVIILPIMIASPTFCKYICPAGTFGGAMGLLINPNNDYMFAVLGAQFTWKFALLIVFVVASIFIFRFFCRFFCPLGAIYGFFNKIALLGVKVDENACTHCGRCVSTCKMDVKRVGDHECINCGQCMGCCPTNAISWKGPKLFTVKSSEQELDVAEETPRQQEAVDEQAINKRKLGKKDKRFWIQLAAWLVALAVLVGAYVYYNVIDVPKPPSGTTDEDIGYEVGQTAMDFTVELYGKNGGSYNLYENRGKLVVINFWATWCPGCVKEMPHFNELGKNHPEIDIIAIHGDNVTDNVPEYLQKNWDGYAVTFAQDKEQEDDYGDTVYKRFGGKADWPRTIIVGADGKVLYNSSKEFYSYEELETLVMGFVNAQE